MLRRLPSRNSRTNTVLCVSRRSAPSPYRRARLDPSSTPAENPTARGACDPAPDARRSRRGNAGGRRTNRAGDRETAGGLGEPSAPVDRPAIRETTALGAAWLAGMKAGICPDAAGFAKSWALERRFEPAMDATLRETRYAAWKDAVRRTLTR